MLRNPKHEAFAREVAANEPVFGERGPALLAAMLAAGYVPALPNGRKLRNRPDVNARVLQLRKANAEFVCADIGRIVQEQASIAFADIRDFYDWKPDGLTLKDLSALPRTLTCAIRKIRFDKEGRAHIELHDKGAALAALQSYREQPGYRDVPQRSKPTEAPSVPVQSPQHTDWAGLVDGPATH